MYLEATARLRGATEARPELAALAKVVEQQSTFGPITRPSSGDERAYGRRERPRPCGEIGVADQRAWWIALRYTGREVVRLCVAIGLVRWLSASRCP
ncbi:hypothetical protein Pflav_079810 [Phytohabitans flavus]|uniref:Uncharacterized protein n=1 Tax=Phytohabitans flavus TaxID=1076124 RepID=A0A6F8Y6I6_9ACTN|nr:hypothetical protein Pflav_079810 [Phytohabitans flavus]